MVYDDTPCSPHGDESLESSFPCNIFETRLSKEEYGEHKVEGSKNVMPWMRIPPYLTNIWMMTVIH